MHLNLCYYVFEFVMTNLNVYKLLYCELLLNCSVAKYVVMYRLIKVLLIVSYCVVCVQPKVLIDLPSIVQDYVSMDSSCRSLAQSEF